MALFVTFIAAVFTIVPTVGGRAGIGLFFGVVFVMIVAVVLLYTVGLSALGGVLGVALLDEFGDRSRDTEPVYEEPPVRSVEEERQDEY